MSHRHARQRHRLPFRKAGGSRTQPAQVLQLRPLLRLRQLLFAPPLFHRHNQVPIRLLHHRGKPLHFFGQPRRSQNVFAALSDRSPCTTCMSVASSIPRATSPGRIRSSLASRLSCRRYPSRIPSCRPRTVVASKAVPYPSAIAASSLSRAVAHGHSRSHSSSPRVPPAAPSPSSWLRSHFLRPLHPCFSLSNHQWWPPHSGHAVFGEFLQLTQSPVFLLRKWRFPSIHLNSG